MPSYCRLKKHIIIIQSFFQLIKYVGKKESIMLQELLHLSAQMELLIL